MRTSVIDIRRCRAVDVDVLELAMPSWGLSRFHERRFEQQESGASVYLIAWDGPQPVGHLNLRWSPGDPAPAALLPECAEVNALGVWPAERRNQGIGSMLLDEAEGRAAAAGRTLIGLAVEQGNHGARRLYERRGYRDWGQGLVASTWTWIDHDGREQLVEELDAYLVRPLP